METDDGAGHFIGHNMESKTGRASTCIVKFDPETRRGVAGSRRINELVGESGVDLNVTYLWKLTCARAGNTSTDVLSDYDQPEIDVQRPIAPFIAQQSSTVSRRWTAVLDPQTSRLENVQYIGGYVVEPAPDKAH